MILIIGVLTISFSLVLFLALSSMHVQALPSAGSERSTRLAIGHEATAGAGRGAALKGELRLNVEGELDVCGNLSLDSFMRRCGRGEEKCPHRALGTSR